MSTEVHKQESIQISCEDNMGLMARYPDNYFDLAIVDPEYGIKVNHSMGRRKGQGKSKHKKVTWDDSIPPPEYFTELFRVSKNQIIWGGNYFTDYLPPSSKWLLWDKGFSEDLTFSQFEMAWTSFEGMTKKYDKNPYQKNKIHPTQKPISLYQWTIVRHAKNGDKILDTHIGSGNIAIALDSVNKIEKMELTLTGCEKDRDHYGDAVESIKKQTEWNSLI